MNNVRLEDRLDRLIEYLEFWSKTLPNEASITLSYLRDLKNNELPEWVLNWKTKTAIKSNIPTEK